MYNTLNLIAASAAGGLELVDLLELSLNLYYLKNEILKRKQICQLFIQNRNDKVHFEMYTNFLSNTIFQNVSDYSATLKQISGTTLSTFDITI